MHGEPVDEALQITGRALSKQEVARAVERAGTWSATHNAERMALNAQSFAPGQ